MPASKSPQAVDTHAHVFSADAAPIAGARYRPAYAATIEAWRAQWARAGVTHGVLVQPSFFGVDNTEMLSALASDRMHLRGVAVVDRDCAAKEIARMDAMGVRAIRLNVKDAGDYTVYRSAEWRSLFSRVHDAGWHVELFVDAGRLAEIAPAFDGSAVAVVFDHFGNPGRDAGPTFAAVSRLAAAREVWCKLSAPYRLEGGVPRDLAARWLDAVGPRRLVWGSDWPGTRFEAGYDYAGLRAALDEWVGARLASAVLWDNPAHLYRFD